MGVSRKGEREKEKGKRELIINEEFVNKRHQNDGGKKKTKIIVLMHLYHNGRYKVFQNCGSIPPSKPELLQLDKTRIRLFAVSFLRRQMLARKLRTRHHRRPTCVLEDHIFMGITRMENPLDLIQLSQDAVQ